MNFVKLPKYLIHWKLLLIELSENTTINLSRNIDIALSRGTIHKWEISCCFLPYWNKITCVRMCGGAFLVTGIFANYLKCTCNIKFVVVFEPIFWQSVITIWTWPRMYYNCELNQQGRVIISQGNKLDIVTLWNI